MDVNFYVTNDIYPQYLDADYHRTFKVNILSVSLQSALSRAIITHTSCLNPPPPLLAVLSDADISTVHLFS